MSSSPASGCPFFTLRLNLVLTHEIPPDSRGGVNSFLPSAASPEIIGSRNCVVCRSRSLPSVGRRRASVVPETGAAFAGHHGLINVRLSFSTPPISIGVLELPSVS